MIDHMSINSTDFSKAAAFYTAALAPLGYHKGLEYPNTLELTTGQAGSVWISQERDEGEPTPRHTAFRAPDAAAVDAFYKAALAAGGTDNGAPGPRNNYGPGYYAAFVIDPDGNNTEAVIHNYKG